jgi:uncharacterized protein (PEP-CTERM system associated)
MSVSRSIGQGLATKLILALVLVSLTFPASAGRWKFRKNLRVSTYSTGNLFLTESDQISSTVLAVRPGIYLTRRGGRVSARVAYAPSLNFYLDDSSLSRVAHYLTARVNSELIKNYFFLSASARAGQVVNDPLRRASFNAINNPDALSNTFSFTIKPDFRGPLLKAGRYARFRIQPAVNYSYTQNGLTGSVGRRTRINVISGPAFARMPWSLNYENDIFDSDTNDGIGRANGRIGFLLSNPWRVDFTLGYDRGRFRSDSNTKGFRWRSTITYRPTSRSRLSLGIGEAFFGDDWVFRFNHRHKHSVWNVRYDRNVENARQELLNEEFIPLRDEFGEPIEDPVSDLPLGVVVSSPVLIDDVYVRDRLDARWSWFRGRTRANLRARLNRRDYQSLELDETDARASLRLSRRFAPKTSGSTNLQYWSHSEETTELNDFDQYAISMRVNHRLSRILRIGVRYSYIQRSSDSGASNYSDNLFGLDFALNFNRDLAR